MPSIDRQIPRFTMLETIREFGLEELAHKDEQDPGHLFARLSSSYGRRMCSPAPRRI
jgi:hypothetical protein